MKINLDNSEYRVDNQISLVVAPKHAIYSKLRHFSIFLDFDKGSAPRGISWFFEIEITISLDGKIHNRSDIEIPVHLWKIEVELQAGEELDQLIKSSINRKLQIVKDYLLTGLDEFWEKNFG